MMILCCLHETHDDMSYVIESTSIVNTAAIYFHLIPFIRFESHCVHTHTRAGLVLEAFFACE